MYQISPQPEDERMTEMHVQNMDVLSSSSNSTPSLYSLSDSDSEKECGSLCNFVDQELQVDKLPGGKIDMDSARVQEMVSFGASKSEIIGAFTKLSLEDNNYSNYSNYSKYSNYSILSPLAQVIISVMAILFWPLLLFDGEILQHSFGDFFRSIDSFYTGAFYTSSCLIGGVTILANLYYGHNLYENTPKKWFDRHCSNDDEDDDDDQLEIDSLGCSKTFFGLGKSAMDANTIIIFIFIVINCFFAQPISANPNWLFYPFDWIPGRYNIYMPTDVSKSLNGLCMDYSFGEDGARPPLCLSENAWGALSGGVLSNQNDDDVAAVLNGIEYTQHNSGGIAINVMCRDCAKSIPTFRRNISNIRQFIPNISVVVFENDSKDGSRDIFKSWATDAKGYGYQLHVIECTDAKDCKLGEAHRYDEAETKGEWEYSSAVGRMADFRNRGIDYIKNNSAFKDYSHVMVYDMDLQVSLSPLGILHSLGSMPDIPVVAHGLMPFAASLGSLNFPYDLVSSRPIPTKKNYRLRKLHDVLVSLAPAGHRWRNLVESVSPFRMMMHLADDRFLGNANNHESFYQVESSYNGAVLYPLERIRQVNPRYDIGDDGQRCEHVGFNKGLNMPLFVNRKWNFHLKPSGGGPTGKRCMMSGNLVTFNPQIGFPIFAFQFIFMFPFVVAVSRITMFLIYPVFFRPALDFFRTKSHAYSAFARIIFGGYQPKSNKYLLPKTV